MARSYFEIGEYRWSGEKCSNCGTTYYKCSKGLHQQGLGLACCDECSETDTHDAHKVGLLSVKAQEKEEPQGIVENDLKLIIGDLNTAWDMLNRTASLRGAAIELVKDGVHITAVLDGEDWRLRFRDGD